MTSTSRVAISCSTARRVSIAWVASISGSPSRSGIVLGHTGTISAMVALWPSAPTRVTLCPAVIRPSTRSATTASIPPYAAGGRSKYGGMTITTLSDLPWCYAPLNRRRRVRAGGHRHPDGGSVGADLVPRVGHLTVVEPHRDHRVRAQPVGLPGQHVDRLLAAAAHHLDPFLRGQALAVVDRLQPLANGVDWREVTPTTAPRMVAIW